MNKQPLLAVVAAALMVCGNAQAEFLFGGQGGFSESDGEYKVEGVGSLEDEEGGGIFGVFAQYRHTLGSGTKIGVHLGWGADSTEWKYEVDQADLADYDDELVSGSLAFEMGDSIDLLGLVVFPGERVKPLVMLGYSSVEVEGIVSGTLADGTSDSVSDSATLGGWKIAGGAEFPFSENWLGHLVLHYADYGDKDIEVAQGLLNETIEMTQTGIRFGVAYSF